MRGNHIVTKVNGKIVEDFRDEGGPATGHFALEVMYAPTTVHFKKIEIKELPPVPAANQESLPPTFKNNIGMEFVIVPKGKSWLGGGAGKPGDKEVEIKQDFYLGV